jgi:RimJ/RimL family protein N-acetyltransferase
MPADRHFPAIAGFVASPRAAARGWSLMPHEAWRELAFVVGHHALRGFGPLVAETTDGATVGVFGPWHPEGQPEAELKWTIWNADFEGRGYAAEAARACRDHAYRRLGWTGAVSYIHPDNTRSQALAARLGARHDGDWTTPRGTLVGIWRHPAPGKEAAA